MVIYVYNFYILFCHESNNMRWNDGKFQVLRVGPNKNIKEDTLLFSPRYENIIDSKECMKGNFG